MYKLETIAERIRQNFDVRTSKRDVALKQARQLTRACSLAIRAVHRDDREAMEANLAEAQTLADVLRGDLKAHPELFFAGYTQDSLKEFVEAKVTCALIQNQALQTPEELGVEDATYLMAPDHADRATFFHASKLGIKWSIVVQIKHLVFKERNVSGDAE